MKMFALEKCLILEMIIIVFPGKIHQGVKKEIILVLDGIQVEVVIARVGGQQVSAINVTPQEEKVIVIVVNGNIVLEINGKEN